MRAKFLLGKAKSGVTCNLPVQLSSSKSTSFMLNVAFDFVLVRFSSSKLEFVAIQRLQKHSSFLIVCVLISGII